MAWLPKKLVLVPIDFSGMSVAALKTAVQFVENHEQVHCVHVVPHLDNMSPGVDWGKIDDKSRHLAVVEHFDGFLEEHGYANVTPIVLQGDPGTEIAEYAVKKQCELIVIPSHGYDGVKRMMLGSVAERVIRYAECAVLVLRREDAE